MRSPQERTWWTGVIVVLLAAAVAAWWTADQWRPHAGPWAKKAWRTATRPPPPQRGEGAAAARKPADATAPAELPQSRKCLQGNRTTYTDKPCPAGSDEQLLDPAINVLRQ